MSSRKRRVRTLTEDEKLLWEKVAATVAPLSAPVRGTVIEALDEMLEEAREEGMMQAPAVLAPLAAPPASGFERASAESLQALIVGEQPSEDKDHLGKPKPKWHALHHGESPGVDRRTADRFRRGRMTIDGRIDLHGMTQEQAHIALHHFIESRYAVGARSVLVITGKGARGEGVLRRAVPRWLNDARLRPLILSFSYAQIPDGGDGALYVLLRRHREERL